MRASAFAGAVVLRPGVPEQALHSSRQDWVPRLSAGRPADALPGLLANLFTLCAHAHRWTASRAVASAQGQGRVATEGELTAHRLATLRDQLLRIHHDWPRLLPGAPAPEALAAQLREAPAWRASGEPGPTLSAMAPWLAEAWLAGLPPAVWLARWRADPAGWPGRWLATAAGPLADLLRSQRAASELVLDGPSLRLPADDLQAWQALGTALREQPGFALRPHWRGQVPDTGPWSRLAWAMPVRTAWDRLLARVVEVLLLAEAGESPCLAHGQCSPSPGVGLAWCEMARGLLVHQVVLAADGQTVAEARVLAPTEWNCHPEGVLARAVAQLRPGVGALDAASRLAVAFDPCVPFSVQLGDTARAEEWTCMN